MTPEQIEQERAAFEQYFNPNEYPLIDLSMDNEDYVSSVTSALFRSWLARAEQAGWISVEDSLPETEGYVIVAWANGYVDLSRFTHDKYSHGGSWHPDFIPDDITHWQPLPQPPKGDPE